MLPDGTRRFEVDGRINELINAMPTARLDGMTNKLFDSNRSSFNKAINLLTGARISSVDVEQELKLRLQDYLKDKARAGQVGETLVYFSRMESQAMPEDLKIVLASLKTLQREKRKQKNAGLLKGSIFRR